MGETPKEIVDGGIGFDGTGGLTFAERVTAGSAHPTEPVDIKSIYADIDNARLAGVEFEPIVSKVPFGN